VEYVLAVAVGAPIVIVLETGGEGSGFAHKDL
jgi:hypothetical protein